MPHMKPFKRIKLRTLLYYFGVVEIINKGDIYKERQRMNPYNPLTYIVIAIIVLLAVPYYCLNALRDLFSSNPFKWS